MKITGDIARELADFVKKSDNFSNIKVYYINENALELFSKSNDKSELLNLKKQLELSAELSDWSPNLMSCTVILLKNEDLEKLLDFYMQNLEENYFGINKCKVS